MMPSDYLFGVAVAFVGGSLWGFFWGYLKGWGVGRRWAMRQQRKYT